MGGGCGRGSWGWSWVCTFPTYFLAGEQPQPGWWLTLLWLCRYLAGMSASDRVVVVLGGAGTVGSGIVKSLLERGRGSRRSG